VIQIAPSDLVAIKANGRYYFALIRDRMRLFGGDWTLVFHGSGERPLSASEVLSGHRSGYDAFVDFIWAKREARLTRLARKIDTGAFQGPGRLKATHALKEKARLWFIYDMSFRELKRGSRLSPEEATYPESSRIADAIMARRADSHWTPEQDSRI
jgi:hypothetical protein